MANKLASLMLRKKGKLREIIIQLADVAELVDAHASGACDRKVMGVRFSPSAPFDSAPSAPRSW